jgi:hypothetical protein
MYLFSLIIVCVQLELCMSLNFLSCSTLIFFFVSSDGDIVTDSEKG